MGAELLVEGDGAGEVELAGDQGGDAGQDVMGRSIEPVRGLEEVEFGLGDVLGAHVGGFGEPCPELGLGRLEVGAKGPVIGRGCQSVIDRRISRGSCGSRLVGEVRHPVECR